MVYNISKKKKLFDRPEKNMKYINLGFCHHQFPTLMYTAFMYMYILWGVLHYTYVPTSVTVCSSHALLREMMTWFWKLKGFPASLIFSVKYARSNSACLHIYSAFELLYPNSQVTAFYTYYRVSQGKLCYFESKLHGLYSTWNIKKNSMQFFF